MGGRELLLIVRAEDRASGALRRIGRDMQGLSRMGQLQHRQQQLAINAATKQQQLQRAARDIESRTTGTTAMALQKRRSELEKARTLNMQRQSSILRDQVAMSTNVSKAKVREATLSRQFYDAQTARQKLLNRLRAMKDPAVLPGHVTAAELDPKGAQAKAQQKAQLLRRDLKSNMQLQNELRAAQSNAARVTAQTVAGQAGLTAAYGNTRTRAAELVTEEHRLAQAHALNNTRISELRSQLTTTGQRLSLIRQQQAGLNKEIRRARWEPLARGGAIMQHMTRVFQYGGAALVGGLGLAAHAAAKFEQQVTLAATQTGPLGSGIKTIAANAKVLRTAIMAVGRDSTSSLQELSAAAYDIFSSLTIPGNNLKQLKTGAAILKEMSKAAIGGMTDVGSVTNATVAVFSAFKGFTPNVENTRKILNRMFAAVRFGRMTFGQFTQTLGTTAPAAAAAGQSFNTLAGTVAFLSRPLGITKAAVGFARLTEILGRKKMVDGLKAAGVSIVDANGKMNQMPEIIDKITKKFPELTKGGVALVQFFKKMSGTEGTIQARRAFVFLAQQLTRYRTVLGQTTKDNNEYRRSVDALNKTPAVRFTKAVNALKVTLVGLGADAIPAFTNMLGMIQKVITAFNGLSDSTKASIGKWGAYSGGILLIASGLTLVLGTVVRLIAVLGARGLLFGSFVAGIVAVSIAIAALHGGINSLSDVISALVSQMTGHGWQGWAIGLGVAAVGAYKLANGLRAVAAASALVGTAQGAGGAVGLLGGLGRGSRGIKELYQVRRLEGAGRSMAMLAASAAMVPGPLWIAGAAIAAAAAGVLLWKHHMDNVAKVNEKVAAALERNRIFAARPAADISVSSGMSNDILNLRQAQVLLKGINLQIGDVRKQMRQPGADRAGLGLQLEQLSIEKARAIGEVGTAITRANQSFAAQTNAVRNLSSSYLALVKNQVALKTLQQELAAKDRVDPRRISGKDEMAKLLREISIRRQNVAMYKEQIAMQQQQLRLSVRHNLRGLAIQGLIPKASPQFSNEIAALQVRLQRQLTRKEIIMYVRARLKGDVGGLSGQLRSFFKMIDAQLMRKAGAQSVVTIKPKVRIAAITGFGKNPFAPGGAFSALGRLKAVAIRSHVVKPGNQGAVQKATAAFFSAHPAKMHVQVIPPPNLHGIGANITAGIQAGMTSVNQKVTVTKVTNSILNEFKTQHKSGSPSKLFADEVGVPIIDGIILGILRDRTKIEKTAQLVTNLFQGAFLQARESKLTDTDPLKVKKYEQQAKDALARFKKTHKEIDKIRAAEYTKKADKARGGAPLSVKDLIKDTQGQAKAFAQFNNAIAKLVSRGLPKELVDQLAAMGVEGLKYIMLLANATPAQLAKFVRAWKNMTSQVKRSQRETVENTKQMHDDMVAELATMATDASQKLLDMYNNFQSINTQNFGELFQGPMNLSSMTGSNFSDAMDSYQSQVADYQLQLDDLRGQINSLTADTIRQKVEELQGVFGDLFHGPWLSDKLDWGKALKMKDLQRDLDEQLKRFRDWRGALNKLLSRGVSRDMLKQLEALGPDATDMLNVLNQATDEELTKYIGTWNAAQGDLKQVASDSLAFDQDYQRAMGAILFQISQVEAAMSKLQPPHALTGADILADLQAQIDAWEKYQGVLQQLIDRGLPDELIMQLSQMGPDALPYLLALAGMTDEQLNGPDGFVAKWEKAHKLIADATAKQMEIQLKMWRKHGNDIAAAIIAGVMDEQYALLAFFRQLFMDLLAGNATDLSKLPTGSPGGDSGGGGGGGSTGGTPIEADPTGGGQRGGVQMFPSTFRSTATSGGTTVNQTIIAHQDETLDTTLARSKFRYETRLPE